jgi:hypothetical protein
MDRAEEELYAFAEMAEDVANILAFWLSQTLIGSAVGATTTEPDWLNQHALDRGTRRQSGESDSALRQRLRNTPESITRQSLIDAAQAIVDDEGVSVTVPVEWVSDVNVLVADADIEKDAGGAGWNAGAISQERVMPGEDGYVEWKVDQNNKSCICGLNYRSAAATQADIDYGLQTDATGQLRIYEKGVQRGTTYGSYTASDSFRVSVDDGVVTYWHKPSAGSWTMIYTSAVAPSFPLRMDASIYDVGSVIANAEIVQKVRMVELRRDKGYFGDFTSDTGTGGTFSGTPPSMKFAPDSPGWARPPLVLDYPRFGYNVKFGSTNSPGNAGEFLVTGLDGDKAEYQNASGVAEYDATCTWTAKKLDQDGNVADGYNRAYFSRGYRMVHGRPNTIIVILPYGSGASTVVSVEEMLRQKKGAGIRYYVERRQNP